jgi:serine/threonine-protein kinase RsbT
MTGRLRMSDELTIAIAADTDILVARQKARELGASLRFSPSDITLLATAISEVARNILVYAQRGEVVLQIVKHPARRGVMVIARDRGPGIVDINRAMQDGFSSSASLGLGLPGAKRLMDEFNIESVPGRGTTVTMVKWEM